MTTLENSNNISQDESLALKTIETDGNQGMHDLDEITDSLETEANIKLVYAYSRKLTLSLYKSIHKNVPEELMMPITEM